MQPAGSEPSVVGHSSALLDTFASTRQTRTSVAEGWDGATESATRYDTRFSWNCACCDPRCLTIPIANWLVQACANSDSFPTFAFHQLKDELGEITASLWEHVMLNSQQVSIFWRLCNYRFDNIFRLLDLVMTRMKVVLGIQVVMDEVVAESFYVGTATRFRGAVAVRSSEVGWVFATHQ